MIHGAVVIGANFGDEGKGAAVDALAAHAAKPLVVRFNGGAQAGHTVVTPEGKRHVFSHFGSGTLVGAPTYLGPKFVINPELFRIEFEELLRLGVAPRVYAHPDCRVTIPTDVIINRLVEEHRGINRHGSCGVGFGETIERHEGWFSTRLTSVLRSNVLGFETFPWIERRLASLGVPFPPDLRRELETSHSSWMDDFRYLASRVEAMHPHEVARYGDYVIFEGAQGLMLDQDSPFFPHVTRSSTGLRNVIPLARAFRVEKLDVHYLTRTYLTRHGAGPLPGEEEAAENEPFEFEDNTNLYNPWQEHIRFAPLIPTLTRSYIEDDLAQAKRLGSIEVKPGIGVSCLDQKEGSRATQVAASLGFPLSVTADGPTRNDRVIKGRSKP